MSETSLRKPFEAMVPAVLHAIGQLLNDGHYSPVMKVLQALIDLAETSPQFFKSHLVSVVNAMIMIASTTQLEMNIRHLAVEFLTTLAEGGGAMVRKLPDNQFINLIIPLLFNMLLDIEDIGDSWEMRSENDEEEEDNMSDCLTACSTLDRLSSVLKAKRFLPVAFSLMTTFLQNPDWRYRHATFVALSHVGEIIPNDPKQREMVVHQIRSYLMDPHPRVRYAAIMAIGQLSVDMCPHIQIEQHANIIPTLLVVIHSDPSMRVKGHALAALANFTDECETRIIVIYLSDIMNTLIYFFPPHNTDRYSIPGSVSVSTFNSTHPF